MPKYNYVAMDSHGKETKGTLEVSSQNEAIGRVKEMGLFPTKIVEIEREKPDRKAAGGKGPAKAGKKQGGRGGWRRRRVVAPPLRIHGKGAKDQRENHCSDVLPGGGAGCGNGHFDRANGQSSALVRAGVFRHGRGTRAAGVHATGAWH